MTDSRLYSQIESLSPELKKEVSDYLSIASLWEIAIKLSAGKLKLDVSFDALKEEVLSNGFEILPIEFQHLQALLNLDFYHRDPFDRIIIA